MATATGEIEVGDRIRVVRLDKKYIVNNEEPFKSSVGKEFTVSSIGWSNSPSVPTNDDMLYIEQYSNHYSLRFSRSEVELVTDTYVTTSTAALFDGPDFRYDKIVWNTPHHNVPSGQRLKVLNKRNATPTNHDWIQIDYNGQIGWVYSSHVEWLANTLAKKSDMEFQAANDAQEQIKVLQNVNKVLQDANTQWALKIQNLTNKEIDLNEELAEAKAKLGEMVLNLDTNLKDALTKAIESHLDTMAQAVADHLHNEGYISLNVDHNLNDDDEIEDLTDDDIVSDDDEPSAQLDLEFMNRRALDLTKYTVATFGIKREHPHDDHLTEMHDLVGAAKTKLDQAESTTWIWRVAVLGIAATAVSVELISLYLMSAGS